MFILLYCSSTIPGISSLSVRPICDLGLVLATTTTIVLESKAKGTRQSKSQFNSNFLFQFNLISSRKKRETKYLIARVQFNSVQFQSNQSCHGTACISLKSPSIQPSQSSRSQTLFCLSLCQQTNDQPAKLSSNQNQQVEKGIKI